MLSFGCKKCLGNSRTKITDRLRCQSVRENALGKEAHNEGACERGIFFERQATARECQGVPTPIILRLSHCMVFLAFSRAPLHSSHLNCYRLKVRIHVPSCLLLRVLLSAPTRQSCRFRSAMQSYLIKIER